MINIIEYRMNMSFHYFQLNHIQRGDCKVTMTNLLLNEKNKEILNAILEDGFMFIDGNYHPKNINLVISFLLEVADGEGYLTSRVSKLYDEFKRKENEEGF